MRLYFVIIILSFFSSIEEKKYIMSTQTNNHEITINFSNSTSLKCKIKKEDSNRYFLLQNEKIYIDVSQEAKWKQNIDSLLKSNTVRPKLVIGEPLPIIFLVFIVDEDGKIIYKGMDNESSQKNYQKEFFRLMTLIESDLYPAVVNRKKVSSILKLSINYYQLFDK